MRSCVLLRLAVFGCLVGLCLVIGFSLQPFARAAEEGATDAAAPGAESPRKVLRAGGYGGSEVCGACHTGNYRHEQSILHGKRLLSLEQGKRSWDCEGCHGPAKAHVEDPINGPKMAKLGELSPARFSEVCLQCHQKLLRKHEWVAGEHSGGGVHCYQCHELAKGVGPNHLLQQEPELCLGCHREKAAEFGLNSHHPVLREHRMRCTDCHAVHRQMALPVGDSEEVRRRCTQCHKQQRGPYVFEHAAVSGGLSDGCLDCHRPHSSPNRDLLRLTGRGLCLACHPDQVLHFPGPDCITCHTGFHGSNSDPNLLAP